MVPNFHIYYEHYAKKKFKVMSGLVSMHPEAVKYTVMSLSANTSIGNE